MDINDKSLQYLTSIIEGSKNGFDIDVLDKWYFKIIEYTKEDAPHHLVESIGYEQDDVLPMKFKINCSKRAVPHLNKAIEHYLPEMQYVTQLYFQVVQQIIQEEYDNFPSNLPNGQ